MIEIILETLIDCLKMLPILYLAYLLMEYLEYKAGEKLNRTVSRVGAMGPLIGGFLGAVPQCGFSGAIAGFYAARIVTLGTLLSVFLSTSDEMLPILISSNISPIIIAKILLFKIAGGIIFGFLIDLVLRLLKRTSLTSASNIHDFCEQEHCDCHENIFISALKHTIKVIILIFIVSFALNLIFEYVGNDALKNVIINQPVIGEMISGAVGLIPNCSSSVLITNLFVEGVITPGAMISGLMTNAGVGLLVLFRLNKHLKENLIITAVLYVGGVSLGILSGYLWQFI